MTKPNGSDGRTELSIEERKGAVVMQAGEFFMTLKPEEAMGIGEMLMRYGFHAQTGKEMDGKMKLAEDIRKLSDDKRRVLENRVMLMIANWQEKKYKPMMIAEEAVNIVLKEVL